MADTVYDIGDLVRVTVTFTNFAGAVADPTSGQVTFAYRAPGASAVNLTYPTDPALVRESTGVYHVDISITDDGKWRYRATGAGAVIAAVEGDIVVRASQFV